MMIASRYQGFVMDLDGTVYLGEQALPGARETIATLRKAGKQVLFVSNKPLEPRANYAAKLTELGIPTPAEDVINSTRALVRYLQGCCPGAGLYVIGEPALLDELRADGLRLTELLDEIDIVVASFDRTLTYAKLHLAHQALVRGARFYATNADPTCPMPGGALPDCAGVIAFLEATTGRKVEMVAGKPSRHILEAALQRLGLGKEKCLMVGDRLATDIAMGQRAGMDTALVLTGVTTRAMLAQSPVQPTYLLDTLADLLLPRACGS
jgi:arabinose operon protein AraL